MKFAAAQWAPSIGADATGGKLFSAEGMQNYNLLLITPPEGWYITHRTLITPPEGWYLTLRIGMVIHTQETKYSTGGMVIKTQDIN